MDSAIHLAKYSAFPLTSCILADSTSPLSTGVRACVRTYVQTNKPECIHLSENIPECRVNILTEGSGMMLAAAAGTAVLPGGVPVMLLPPSRGLLPEPPARFALPCCSCCCPCGGVCIPAEAASPTRPTCCPILRALWVGKQHRSVERPAVRSDRSHPPTKPVCSARNDSLLPLLDLPSSSSSSCIPDRTEVR